MGSQEQAILSALKAGKILTDDSARELCGSHRLAARICELRKKGYNISTVMQSGINRYGHEMKYAEYRFVGGQYEAK